MKIFLETERLILREILPSDLDGLFELDSDPEVHRYLGNQPVKDKTQIVEIIQFIRQQYLDYGIGRWAVVDKQSKEFMGWAGLKWITTPINNHVHYYDLGYRLIKKHWGKGIATESAQAALIYAFEQLNAQAVYAMADCENIGSNHVLQKVGLHFVETFDFEGIVHNWYKIVQQY
jgi:RimJ/RimL family protein N-acetyltransferase